MLYIFRVDTGSMMTLEMSLALETVAHLRRAVASTWSIPEDKQVGLESRAKRKVAKIFTFANIYNGIQTQLTLQSFLPLFFLQIIAFQLRMSEEPILFLQIILILFSPSPTNKKPVLGFSP